MTTDVIPADAGTIMESVVIAGDLARLTPQQRATYYLRVCESVGLNPLTRPFDYITLNGKLTLYANRGASDQLRSLRGITITSLEPRQVGDLLVVIATGRDGTGREDSSTGVVAVKGLSGEALANAMMKAETKAKRRLTLSLAGLGWTDETEIGSIPSAVAADVDPETGEIRKPKTLAEKVAERREVILTREEVAEGTEPLIAESAEAGAADSPLPAPALPTYCLAENEALGTGPCAKPAGHDGAHRNKAGTWPA